MVARDLFIKGTNDFVVLRFLSPLAQIHDGDFKLNFQTGARSVFSNTVITWAHCHWHLKRNVRRFSIRSWNYLSPSYRQPRNCREVTLSRGHAHTLTTCPDASYMPISTTLFDLKYIIDGLTAAPLIASTIPERKIPWSIARGPSQMWIRKHGALLDHI